MVIKKIKYKFICTLGIYISSSVNLTIIILDYFFSLICILYIFHINLSSSNT